MVVPSTIIEATEDRFGSIHSSKRRRRGKCSTNIVNMRVVLFFATIH